MEIKQEYIDKLIEATENVTPFAPWEYMGDNDVFCFKLKPTQKDWIFVNIRSNEEGEFTIYFFKGKNGYNSLLYFINRKKYNLHDDFIYANTDALVCTSELNNDEMSITWKRLKRGYLPLNVTEKDVLLLTDYLQSFAEILTEINGKQYPSYNYNDTIFATKYNNEWKIQIKALIFDEPFINKLTLFDEEYEEVNSFKRTKSVLEIALVYPGLIKEKENKVENQGLVVITNPRSLIKSKYDIVKASQNPHIACLDILNNYIYSYGIPKKVNVENKIVYTFLKDYCDQLGIEIVIKKPLKAAYGFVAFLLVDDEDEANSEVC